VHRGCWRGLDRGSLLDAGCGSGVVAVAAARLGFAPVRAVDLDEVAVEVAGETARRNGVAVDVSQADVLGTSFRRATSRSRTSSSRSSSSCSSGWTRARP
jgi:ribosomal protein L11 methylase PrmA